MINSDIENKLTPKEKRKLILIVLGLFLFEIIIGLFFISLILVYRKPDWVFIIASILFPAMVIAVFKAALYYIKDIKVGEVEVYRGMVEKMENRTYADQPSSFYITVDGCKHQISSRNYSELRIYDYVMVRKAPFSHYTVGVVVGNLKLDLK